MVLLWELTEEKQDSGLDIEKIYLDLDGVLVNFDKFASDVIGIGLNNYEQDKKVKSQFWERVNKHVKGGNAFFQAMEPMPDAFELWEYVKEYNPIILSATGNVKGAADEKREWVRNHLGDNVADSAILVYSAKDKAQYASPNAILIDDRSKAIDPWVDMGGIGILHTNTNNTIEQLKQIGI